MKKRLILVGGFPAAGKTTFSRALSEKLNIPCYNKDTLNEVIGERMTIPDAEERRKLSVTSFHLLMYIADMALSAQKTVMLESNFKPEEVPFVQALIDKHRCQTLTFVLVGEMRAIFDRFMEREGTSARHPIHKSRSIHDFEPFCAAIAPLAGFEVEGRRVIVDTTDFSVVDFEGLYSEAERFVSEI